MFHKKDDTRESLNAQVEQKYVLSKLMKYCAYQERSSFDVQKKLDRYQIQGEKALQIMGRLISEGFIDDLRFATAYTFGKLRSNHWGRNKIRYGLREKKIGDEVIEKALNQINEEEYRNVMIKLVRQKDRSVKDQEQYIRQNKIVQFLAGKGFEPSRAWEIVKDETE